MYVLQDLLKRHHCMDPNSSAWWLPVSLHRLIHLVFKRFLKHPLPPNNLMSLNLNTNIPLITESHYNFYFTKYTFPVCMSNAVGWLFSRHKEESINIKHNTPVFTSCTASPLNTKLNSMFYYWFLKPCTFLDLFTMQIHIHPIVPLASYSPTC